MAIWTYPNVRVYPLVFCLVVNGIIRVSEDGQMSFQTEHGARGLWRELYAKHLVKDTDQAAVWTGVSTDNLSFHSPIN
jgi:hypothetical protein